MVREARKHISIGDSPTLTDVTPKHLKREEFARRLYKLMTGKGWRQSDLSMHSGVPKDAISVYINAKAMPTTPNLNKIASALSVRPEELLPNHLEDAVVESTPAFEMKVSNSAPGVAWLRINRAVSTSLAVKIAEMLQNDDAFNGAGGGADTALQQIEGEAAAAEREAPVRKRASRARG